MGGLRYLTDEEKKISRRLSVQKYNSKPEVKIRNKLWRQKHDGVIKEYKRQSCRDYKKDPDWIARTREDQRKYNKGKGRKKLVYKKLSRYKNSKAGKAKLAECRKRWWESKGPAYASNWSLKRKFGITMKNKEDMYVEQGGLCLICDKEFKTMSHAHVDHCHKTGKIRGLVHSHCNMIIGFVEKRRKELVAAMKYAGVIEQYKKDIEELLSSEARDSD